MTLANDFTAARDTAAKLGTYQSEGPGFVLGAWERRQLGKLEADLASLRRDIEAAIHHHTQEGN